MVAFLNATNANLLPVLGATFPIVVICFTLFIDRRRRAQTIRPPQNEKLLRTPGYSLSKKVDSLTDSVLTNITLSTICCAIAAASVYLAGLSWGHIAGPVSFRTLFPIVSILSAGGAILFLFTALHRFREARNHNLGLRGEQVVAQALYEAAAESGYRIYHDLPVAELGNIDHVAVGERGVFAVETKARTRRGSRRHGQREHEVVVHKKTLRFPTGFDDKSAAQAERAACWLSDFLSQKLHIEISVTPILVLPGWFITFAEPERPIQVCNAKSLITHLSRQEQTLPSDQATRIAAELDKLCRNVEF